jgi:ribosomal-protein-alanine N-acetyltransferase
LWAIEARAPVQSLAVISLRDYRPRDFEAMLALDRVCFTEGISYTSKELADFIEMRGAFTVVAEFDDQLAGFVIGHADRRGIGHIITIDVAEAFRRQGLGSQMLDAVESRLSAGGCSRVVLEVAVNNSGAIAFYKRHGYSVLKTLPRYYMEAIDALVMGKSIEAAAASRRAEEAR